MEVVEITLLLIGMAFFGIAPPFLVGWFIMKQGQKYAEKRTTEVVTYAQKVLEQQMKGMAKMMIDEVSDRAKESLRDSFNGLVGNKVSQLKKKMETEMKNNASPMGVIIGDFVGGAAQDYGYGKKNTVSAAIRALFTKKDPNALENQQQAVQALLTPEQQMIVEEYKNG